MIDPISKFIALNSYKFEKGYPDLTNPADKKLLFTLVKEATGEDPKKPTGYAIGTPKVPTETLESRNWNFQNKTGYLGTGYYFYGDLENAKQDLETLKNTRDNIITEIDLTQYKLYRASDPEYFYDTIASITQQIGDVAPQIEESEIDTPEMQEVLQEIVDVVIKELGLPLQEGTVVGIVVKFIRDVREKNNGVMLSNRLLDRLGYEGIDNTNTPLDNYGVGSVLFVIKPSSLRELPS